MTWKEYRRTRVAATGTMFTKTEILRLLIPLIIEQLLNYLVGLGDSVMVSSAGDAAVSAVSLVDTISVLMVNVFSALAAGGAIVVGQYLGRGTRERAQNAARQMMAVLLVLSVAVMALLLIFEEPILRFLFGKSEAVVQENCRTYYHIVMQSVPFIALYNGGAALFRGVGDSRTPMRISFLMNAVNIAGNALLIYGLRLGVAGVAIPTLVSRGIAMVLILVLSMRKSFPLNLRDLRYYRFEGLLVKQILSMGVPNSLESGMFQMGKILLFSLVSTLPTFAITANAIGNSMVTLHSVIGSSVNLGMVSIVSRCVGAGDYPQARWYIEHLVGFVYKVQGVTCSLMLAAIPLILRAYHATGETARLAGTIMLIHGIGIILIWPAAFCFNTGMRAAGDVRHTMVVAAGSMWLCRVGLGCLFVLVFHTGVLGIWFAWLIDWTFRICFFLPRYFSGKWETKAISQR